MKSFTEVVDGGCSPRRAPVTMLSTDQSVIGRRVRVLEDMGFVGRRPGPADHADLYRSLRRWDEADVRRLAELLERLNDVAGVNSG